MIRRFTTSLLCTCLLVLVAVSHVNAAAATLGGQYHEVYSDATGTGSYLPLSGYFFGPGDSPQLGNLIYNGTLVLTPVGDPANGLFEFENAGRGTNDEVFQETMYEDGSTLSTRHQGTVQLIPVLDSENNPTGKFTAQWTGVWRVVRGTGRFHGARGKFDVTAINDPFDPTMDYVWNFSWSWSGTLYIPKRTKCVTFDIQTGGHGKFDPANLGLGDPSVFPIPLVIGDGSGAGIYDGTPTGNEFTINGHLVGNGFDRHFGNAQSIAPGVFVPQDFKFRYPGKSGETPDGSGRSIHIMKTWLGEIWFKNQYYFELDPTAGLAGVITGRADFRIVGGTWFFRRARGSVFVKVVSDLANDFDPGNPELGIPPSADFRYDFQGYLEYCLFRN